MQARERILAVSVGLLVGGWLLDSMVIEPGLAWLAKVREETRVRAAEAADAQVLIDRKQRIAADWQARHAAGLLDDEDGARFRVQQALAASARSGGFAIESVAGGQRVPAAAGQSYDLLRLTVSGEGTLAQAQAFIAGLESSAQPLRLERCELASRDARKDLIDATLTLSTRIVSLAGRAGRGVPAGTKPWSPAARDASLDAPVLAARPFQVDHRAARQPGAAVAHSEASEPRAAPTSKGWALVGIVAADGGGAKAFVHNLDDGSEHIVAAGEHLGANEVVSVGDDGMRVAIAGEEKLIAVGCDLNGQRLALPRQAPPSGSAAPAHAVATPAASGAAAATSAVPTTTASVAPASAAPAAPAAPAAFPATTVAPDPDRDAILQRLRQQRNRSP